MRNNLYIKVIYTNSCFSLGRYYMHYMYKLYKRAQYLFNILIVLITIVSLYMLAHKLYYKTYHHVYSWHFPMLLAICIETFI